MYRGFTYGGAGAEEAYVGNEDLYAADFEPPVYRSLGSLAAAPASPPCTPEQDWLKTMPPLLTRQNAMHSVFAGA